MPNRPKQHKPMGAGNTTCKVHKAPRLSAYARGYTKRWQKLRRMVLRREPICRMCERLPAVDVDHIVPKSKGGEDTFENLQGLCHRCHSQKTAKEDGGFGHGDRGV